ncbi:MAG: LysR family transcriptional regulator [Clostridia bacterium]|nr:LysR family transcriptional regulator [Clostridia bacterium]
MNTLHFKYAVEVAKTGSITQAAENLYMAQPNLSKAIKELEETLGITVFRRTSKGVAPTEKGEQFLVYAKRILSQLERMESLQRPTSEDCRTFSICVPAGSYISHAITNFVKGLGSEKEMNIRVKESSSMDTVHSVANGEFNLGIVRIPGHYDHYYQAYFKEKDLVGQLIWEYEYPVLMSAEHPLAEGEVSYEALGDFIEICYEEIAVPYLQIEEFQGNKETPHARRQIHLQERSSQYNMLSNVTDSYMWAPPVPPEVLTRYGLVQRRCPRENNVFRDVLIYPKDYTLTSLDREFADVLFITKNQVAFGGN